MKLSLLSIVAGLFFLAIQEQGTKADDETSSSSSPKFNGKCDLDFCACVVNVPPGSIMSVPEGCPAWMSEPTKGGGGGAFGVCSKPSEDSMFYGPGQIACSRMSDSVFEKYPSSWMDCSDYIDESFNNTSEESLNISTTADDDVVPHFVWWYIRDGGDEGDEILVEYDEDNPPPECPWSKPLSEPPTAAPTSSAESSGVFVFRCLTALAMMMMMVSVMMW